MARFSLIPKDGRFFDDFILLAQELRKASRVLADMLTPDHPRWEAADERGVLVAWRDRDALLGSEVRWQDGTGIARGVDETGSLIVETAGNGRIALGAGEVHLRR